MMPPTPQTSRRKGKIKNALDCGPEEQTAPEEDRSQVDDAFDDGSLQDQTAVEKDRKKVKDAFGVGSPSWNMPFPNGNMTAIEILAYFPHWLKSIDVIHRFFAHGGSKAWLLADIISEFRLIPDSPRCERDTVYKMVGEALRRSDLTKHDWAKSRRAGFEKRWQEEGWDDAYLNLKEFRCPNITHPKTGLWATKFNKEASPMLFRDLAKHIKTHPTGDDALDLTRCVQYAVNHPDEDWLFPDQIAELVDKLGGPLPVTASHTDRYAFYRRSGKLVDASSTTPLFGELSRTSREIPNIQYGTAPANPPQKRNLQPLGQPLEFEQASTSVSTMAAPNSPPAGRRRSGRLTNKNIPKYKISESSEESMEIKTESRTGGRSSSARASGGQAGGTIKQGRYRELRSKPAVNYNGLDSNYTDTPTKNSEFDDYETDMDDPLSDEDMDSAVSEDEYDTGVENEVNEVFGTPVNGHKRRSARKITRRAKKLATRRIRTQAGGRAALAVSAPAPAAAPAVPRKGLSPELMHAARTFEARKNAFLKPTPLDPERIIIDRMNVALFAVDGAKDPWASAYDYMRYNGPRRATPFRELHLLSTPARNDISAWAENIRWAKEQHRLYGSVWTEYEYSLECITEFRMENLWASEELINGV